MLRAIAIDDDSMTLKHVENLCSLNSKINLQRIFTNIKSARRYIRKFPIDLIFLDVHFPDANGIDFYRTIDQKIMVVFMSGSREHAVGQ